jgi:hypothetical protein
MDALAAKLDSKLREWKPETAQEVRVLVNESMGLADNDALDLMRSRIVEQEVMDLLDEPRSR